MTAPAEVPAAQRQARRARQDLERVTFFSDAVFAIAITLLALDLRLPPGADDEAGLAAALRGLVPQLYGFGLSFAVIAMFWLGHYRTMRWLDRVTPRLISFNLLFLAAIALLPFPTSVLATQGNLVGATLVYGGFVMVAALLSAGLWLLADHGRLLAPEITPAISRHVTIRALAVPVLFAVSLPVAVLAGPIPAQLLWIASIVVQSVMGRQFGIQG